MKECNICYSIKEENEFYDGNCQCKVCKNKLKTEQRIEKKIRLIKDNGNKCTECNYKFNGIDESGFVFYSDKKDMLIKSNIDLSYDILLSKSKQCILLCKRCKRTSKYS